MLEFERKMGCTSAELLRWLPQALDKFYLYTNLVIDGKTFLKVENPQLEIYGATNASRKIALLEIPVLEVRFIFSSKWTKTDCQAVLNRFDLYTRRGGG